MVDFFFVIKIAGAGDELQGIKRVLWKWQIQLSSIKQMAITFERHNSRNQSSTEPYIYFQQKKSGWIPTTATCSAITQDGIPEFGKPSRNLSNSRKAMIILMKTLGTERILDARGYQRTKGNFITIPKYKTCWNQLKSGAKR
jgi:putative protein kinase ArgK-like GTPase of G3E family